MKSIKEASFVNKTALVRVDFNVPLNEEQQITDDSRIKKALPTLEYLLNAGASLMLLSHLGRPKAGYDPKLSLAPVANHLAKLLNRPVRFINDCLSTEAQNARASMPPGTVVLFENVRFYPEETRGDENFARQLANLADVYVNDAFGAVHRAHASTTKVAKFFKEKYAGLLLFSEIQNADKVMREIRRPYIAIIGGAKVSDKINVLSSLIERADGIIIGGAMAFTFLKAQGKPIGKSLCEDGYVEVAAQLLQKAQARGITLLLPQDFIAVEEINPTAQVYQVDSIPAHLLGVDIGRATVEQAGRLIQSAQTILWNGPMGIFEIDAFAQGTLGILLAIGQATQQGAYSLIGGGDSAAAAEKMELSHTVSYISTGGGALLEYLESKVLPGIAALE